MTVKSFSDEWAEQFKDELNRSNVYRSAAKGWKWTVGLVVEAEPDKNFPDSRGVVMDLHDGEARDITVGPASTAQKGDFALLAPREACTGATSPSPFVTIKTIRTQLRRVRARR